MHAKDPFLERPLPHNLEAEQVVIGTALITNSLIPHIAGQLAPGDFFLRSHSLIWSAICELNERGSVDPVIVADWLARQELLAQVGGLAWISSLTDGVPRFTNVDRYIEILREKALRRRLIALSNRTMTAALDDDGSTESLLNGHLAECNDLSLSLSGHGARREDAPLDSVPFVRSWLSDVDFLSVPPGLPTQIEALDDLLLSGGYGEGTCNILAGRTSVGKTMIALQMTRSFCEQGAHVVYFSFEMDRERLLRRLAMQQAGISVGDLRRGQFSDQQLRGVKEFTAQASRWPLAVFSQQTLSVAEIRRRVLHHQAKQGAVDLIVVDHFGLLNYPDRKAGVYQRTVDNSHHLKQFSQDYGQRLLSLVQINRAGDMEARLELRHLEGGGALEQDADTVLLLQKRTNDQPGVGWDVVCTLDKNRDAPVGWFTLQFRHDYGRFTAGIARGTGYWQPDRKQEAMPWDK